MNIYDIAEEAGVSITTVSRILNNKPNVRPTTRKKVEAVLEKHHYTPSAIARGLVSKSMNTVGILTIDVRVPHYASTAYILENELYKIGYNAILCNTGGLAENGADYIRMLLKKGVSGIILIGSVFQNKSIEASLLKNSEIPFIVLNAVATAENTYSVTINHESGMKLALEHLAKKGHQHIAYVQDADTYSGRRKTSAFRKHHPGDRGLIIKTKRGIAGGREAIDRIIEMNPSISAVIFGDDITAIGGVQGLHKRGKSVPGDMAIIGWNNTESEICEPALTTIDNQNDMMGIVSIKMLDNLLNGVDISSTVSIDSNLIIREST